MTKIRFVDFVLAECEAGRYKIGFTFMSGELMIQSLGFETYDDPINIPKDRFSFGAKGIFTGAWLTRGAIGWIKPNREEQKRLRAFWKKVKLEIKEKNRQEKLRVEKERRNAEWWP